MNRRLLTIVLSATALLCHGSLADEHTGVCASDQANAPATTEVKQGRDIALRACTWCHSLDPILGYSSGDWLAVVRDMRTRGATVDDAEVPLLAAYLGHLTRNCPSK